MIGAFQVGWPNVNVRFPELISASAQIAGEKIPQSVEKLLREMCQAPVCMAHVDMRLDNIFFGHDYVAFVDWQSVDTSTPEQDVAYFITQSVPPVMSCARRDRILVVGRS
jgi:hypothetical protein